jgi:CsoR family transcriptional regulator, copper-sensing transcriptional repressor
MTMDEKTKTDCVRRLSRIEGQVRGISAMVSGERYCIDILNQIAAVQSALRRVEEELLQGHVGHCIEGAIASGNAEEQRVKVAELIKVLRRPSR